MATDTDVRLRSRLDSNQRDREQMCRAVLALDPRYSEVRPRQPAGGPDGGRDIEAVFERDRRAFAAVGFANGANDSPSQKTAIRRKFRADLSSAIAACSELKVFAFLTNVRLTVGEHEQMKCEAREAGIEHCDILDRERLRIELDSPGGYFIRFQHLDIPLSEAEQASFLSRYGSQLQDVITTGFQHTGKTLNRLLFLAEAGETLRSLLFRFVLKRSYRADEIGHFRAFVFLAVRQRGPSNFHIWFGSTDRSDRFRDDMPEGLRTGPAGIGAGIGMGQWEQYLPPDPEEDLALDLAGQGHGDDPYGYRQTSWTSSIGLNPVAAVMARYRHRDSVRGGNPHLTLRDLDEATFLPFVNSSLADKVHSIQIFADGYLLEDLGPGALSVDRDEVESEFPSEFSAAELSDPWVRLRPSAIASAFDFRFGDRTPRRMYDHQEPPESPPPAAG